MQDQYEDDDENLQEVDYHKKTDFSKAGIVSDAVSKIKEMRAREMRSGYWNITSDRIGNPIRTYIPDSRKEYIGSVEYLKSVMAHEIETDKRIKRRYRKW